MPERSKLVLQTYCRKAVAEQVVEECGDLNLMALYIRPVDCDGMVDSSACKLRPLTSEVSQYLKR